MIGADKPECPHFHRCFSSISNARHHVRHQSCQRSGACTARAVHHEVAQTKGLHLPPPPGLDPPVIAPACESCRPSHLWRQSRSARRRILSRSPQLDVSMGLLDATTARSNGSQLGPITVGSTRLKSRPLCSSRPCRTATRTNLSRDRIRGGLPAARFATHWQNGWCPRCRNRTRSQSSTINSPSPRR